MKAIKTILVFIFTFMVVFLLPRNARADQESLPDDYAIITADKKFIFVMLIPDEEIMRTWEFLEKEPTFYETRIYDTEISIRQYWSAVQKPYSLRTKYPCSGLYKNDGSTTPIWTVNWYGKVYLFPDGEHLIRQGPWNRSWEPGIDSYLDGLAVAFYKNGFEVAKYSVGNLVKDTGAIRFSVSHYQWKEEERFEMETGLLFIKTLDHQEYTFDIREMGKNVEGKNVNCTPNYRFGKTGPFTEPPQISIETETIPTPEQAKALPEPVQNKCSTILIAAVLFFIILGCVILLCVNRQYRG